MTTSAPIDAQERLMLTIMRRFEDDAMKQYEACLPAFLGEDKKAFVVRLRERAPTDQPLDESPLAKPLYELLAATSTFEEQSVLILQGLVMERVREAVYAVLASSERVSEEVRELCAAGRDASGRISRLAPRMILERIGEGETLYEYFARESKQALSLLDHLGEPLDDEFGDDKGLWFSDVVGEYASDLVPLCTEQLSMSRRKVIIHLTSALMGVL